MSLKNGELHALSWFGTIVLTGGIVLGTIYIHGAAVEICDDKAVLDEDADGKANCDDSDCTELPFCNQEEAIEASIAYKKEDAPKQPQKPMTQKAPEELDGVSRDENKKSTEKTCTKDAECTSPEECIKGVCKRPKDQNTETDPLAKLPDRREKDGETSTDSTPEPIGAFDGEKFGVGDVTKGDPYFARLKNDLAWKPPEFAKGTSEPTGCIRIERDGKISDTKFRERGDDDVATLAEMALKALQSKRNEKPEEVPTHLLRELTTKWICFKFTTKPAD